MADVLRKTCDMVVKRGRRKERCEKPVPDDEPTPLTIGTTKYLMDLCQQHQKELHGAIQPFLDIAHDARKRTGTQVRKAVLDLDGHVFTAKDVRNWLRDQGRPVPDAGRLPQSAYDEYVAAHN